MSDAAAAAGDVAIDPKAPFTPGLAGLDRYCRRDAQWANLGQRKTFIYGLKDCTQNVVCAKKD